MPNTPSGLDPEIPMKLYSAFNMRREAESLPDLCKKGKKNDKTKNTDSR